MLSSAVSLALVLAGGGATDLTELELKAWKKIQPAIVFIMDSESVSGTAALISRDGYFLTHVTAVKGKSISARTSDGSMVHLRWIADDEPTQFILLKAENWSPDIQPLGLVESDAGSKSLLAITANGPVRAERAMDTYGIVEPSRRMMRMNEVRLENNLPSLGGSLLFNLNGQLAGAINGALEMTPSQNVQKIRSDGSLVRQGQGGNSSGQALAPKAVGRQYGPGVMAAAYSINPKVLRRVVAGFLSESHQVKHPAIGIMCRDALPQGALIDSVTDGSTADKAGLKQGDVIYAMDNQAIRNQIDFAKFMADQEIGDRLKVWIQRGALRQMITVEVGT